MSYTTEKLSKTRTAIYRDGVYLCQLRPAEVKGWIARAERSDAIDAEFAISQRAYRLENARAYLASRSARAPAAVQLSLF